MIFAWLSNVYTQKMIAKDRGVSKARLAIAIADAWASTARQQESGGLT